MGMIDAYLAFSDGQALTASAASTNVIDLKAERDIGIGSSELTVMLITTTAWTSGGSTTLDIALQVAPDSSGSPGSYITIAQSQQCAIANFAAVGTKIAEIRIPATIPQIDGNICRFMRLNYVVGTSNFTAGAIGAYIVGGGHDNQVYYPPGVTVAN